MKSTILTLMLGLIACGTPAEVSPPEQAVQMLDEIASIEQDTGALEPALPELIGAEPEAVVADIVEVGAPAGLSISVQDGENLSLLAAWSGLTAEAIAEANGLPVTTPLRVGQSLVLPLSAEATEGFETRRQGALAARLVRYQDRRGGELAVGEHTVRTGESAWSIAHDAVGVPTWVLRAYNPGTDMDRLTIGQTLSFPIYTDTLADSADSAEELVTP